MAGEPTLEALAEKWAQIRYEYEHTDRPVGDICAEHNISSGTLRDRMRRWNWRRRRAPIPGEGPPAAPAPQLEHAVPFLPDGPEGAPSLADPATPPPFPPPQAGEGERGGSGGGIETGAASGGGIETGAASGGRIETGAASGGGTETGAAGGAATRHGAASEGGIADGDGAGAPGEGSSAVIVPRLQNAVGRVIPAIEATVAKLAAQPTHPREMERTARVLAALTRTLRELNELLRRCPVPAAHGADDCDDDMPEDIDEFRLRLARRIEAFVRSRTEAGETPEPQDTEGGSN